MVYPCKLLKLSLTIFHFTCCCFLSSAIFFSKLIIKMFSKNLLWKTIKRQKFGSRSGLTLCRACSGILGPNRLHRLIPADDINRQRVIICWTILSEGHFSNFLAHTYTWYMYELNLKFMLTLRTFLKFTHKILKSNTQMSSTQHV